MNCRLPLSCSKILPALGLLTWRSLAWQIFVSGFKHSKCNDPVKEKGWERLCSILPLQCLTAVIGHISQFQEGTRVPLITSSTVQVQQVAIQPPCCELETTLQKSGHLSPFSALAILHWFTQLQNKTNLSTPQSC